MGTEFRIVLYGQDKSLATAALAKAFERIAGLDARLSDYKDDSELSQLSRRAGTGFIAVSDDLWNVLSRAREVSEASQGAFDVTVGPAVRLWRRARRQKELPSPRRIADVLERIGHTQMKLDSRSQSVALQREGMLLDLGGIAKGYATQEALKVLASHAFPRAMVVGGGEVCVGDAPPGEVGWKIAIQPETSSAETKPRQAEYIVLTRRCVSTSGDASQYLELDGRRYSHIVDPRTGQALSVRRQATVTACDGMTADALGSALCVLGMDDAEEVLAKFPGTAARIEEVDERGAIRVWLSHSWPNLAQTKDPEESGFPTSRE